MEVKIENTIYNSEDIPIVITLSDSDKNNIKNMREDNYKYCSYPDHYDPEEIRKWMNDNNITLYNDNKKIYYARCISLFDTPIDNRNIELIKNLGFNIIDPNCDECSEGYSKYGMEYFKTKIKECDIVMFFSLPDGSIPAGVAKEIDYANKYNKLVIEIPSNIIRRTLNVEETRLYLKEIGHR